MTRLLLVRHAHPAATWEKSADPPLDAVGARQAEAVAERLVGRGPLSVATSPLRRARETAAPLVSRWGSEVRITDAVGEIPSPTDALEARGAWLRDVVTRRWGDDDTALHDWRSRLLAMLRELPTDTAVFSHYMAINTAVGAATGDDRVLCCHPAHASVTELAVGTDGALSLLSLDEVDAGWTEDSPL
jgi:broad specificity phosphatase PhoE